MQLGKKTFIRECAEEGALEEIRWEDLKNRIGFINEGISCIIALLLQFFNF